MNETSVPTSACPVWTRFCSKEAPWVGCRDKFDPTLIAALPVQVWKGSCEMQSDLSQPFKTDLQRLDFRSEKVWTDELKDIERHQTTTSAIFRTMSCMRLEPSGAQGQLHSSYGSLWLAQSFGVVGGAKTEADVPHSGWDRNWIDAEFTTCQRLLCWCMCLFVKTVAFPVSLSYWILQCTCCNSSH